MVHFWGRQHGVVGNPVLAVLEHIRSKDRMQRMITSVCKDNGFRGVFYRTTPKSACCHQKSLLSVFPRTPWTQCTNNSPYANRNWKIAAILRAFSTADIVKAESEFVLSPPGTVKYKNSRSIVHGRMELSPGGQLSLCLSLALSLRPPIHRSIDQLI